MNIPAYEIYKGNFIDFEGNVIEFSIKKKGYNIELLKGLVIVDHEEQHIDLSEYISSNGVLRCDDEKITITRESENTFYLNIPENTNPFDNDRTIRIYLQEDVNLSVELNIHQTGVSREGFYFENEIKDTLSGLGQLVKVVIVNTTEDFDFSIYGYPPIDGVNGKPCLIAGPYSNKPTPVLVERFLNGYRKTYYLFWQSLIGDSLTSTTVFNITSTSGKKLDKNIIQYSTLSAYADHIVQKGVSGIDDVDIIQMEDAYVFDNPMSKTSYQLFGGRKDLSDKFNYATMVNCGYGVDWVKESDIFQGQLPLITCEDLNGNNDELRIAVCRIVYDNTIVYDCLVYNKQMSVNSSRKYSDITLPTPEIPDINDDSDEEGGGTITPPVIGGGGNPDKPEEFEPEDYYTIIDTNYKEYHIPIDDLEVIELDGNKHYINITEITGIRPNDGNQYFPLNSVDNYPYSCSIFHEEDSNIYETYISENNTGEERTLVFGVAKDNSPEDLNVTDGDITILKWIVVIQQSKIN